MLDFRASVRSLIGILLLSSMSIASWSEAEAVSIVEATDWLQRYIRIDSSTTEGTLAAGTFLRSLLHRNGITTRWIVSPGGQAFLYAHSSREQTPHRALLLLHHMDVVPAGEGWTQDPFAGDVVGKDLFGRGSIDDKSLGIAHLVSFLRLHRSTEDPRRDLVFLAVSGEEDGGMDGMGWLLDSHPELFEGVEAALTEGGNNRVYGDQLAWWGLEVAQKRPLWLKATASGRPGHGSSLNLHSAPHRLIKGLNRVVERPRDYRLSDEARDFLAAAAPMESPAFQGVVANLDQILAAPEPEKQLLSGMPNYLLDTVQVNGLAAGDRVNVTPGEATAWIDVRLLPDTDQATFLDSLRAEVGEEVLLEVLLSSPVVPPSPTDHPLYQCLEGTLQTQAPVIPVFITAITDARFVRARGIAAYGFSPFVLAAKELRGIHGSNEHIPLEVFARGLETMWTLVWECAGS